jgi:EmrB/QacA subfamily drug resistance transporter
VTGTTTTTTTTSFDVAPVTLLGRIVDYKYVVAAVFVAALFLDILDTTVVNVALRTIGNELQTESIEWIVLGYTLSLAVWIPASGWLGDRFGTKRVFLAALVFFVGGSALCGAAQSIGQLVTFRILQGVGGGMLTPIGVAMMFRAFPPIERARAATIVLVPTLVAPALGPVLGGLITDTIGWRWIFFVNVPVGLSALVFGMRYLREHTEPDAGRFDRPGFVLSGFGLAATIYALSEGPRVGWDSPAVIVLGIGGILSFVLLVWVETHKPQPMLALRLLKDRLFATTNLVMAFSMASFIGVLFVLPLYLQGLRGLDPFESGLVTFPQAIGILISSQIAGRIYASVGPRRLVTGGMAWAALSVAAFMTLGLETNLWIIRGLLLARGLGMGFTFVAVQAASYARIAPSDNGRASAIFATQRQMSVSIGVALMATVLSGFTSLTATPSDPQRALEGYRWTFAAATVLAVIGAIVATRIRDEDAAVSMAPR